MLALLCLRAVLVCNETEGHSYLFTHQGKVQNRPLRLINNTQCGSTSDQLSWLLIKCPWDDTKQVLYYPTVEKIYVTLHHLIIFIFDPGRNHKRINNQHSLNLFKNRQKALSVYLGINNNSSWLKGHGYVKPRLI